MAKQPCARARRLSALHAGAVEGLKQAFPVSPALGVLATAERGALQSPLVAGGLPLAPRRVLIVCRSRSGSLSRSVVAALQWGGP